MGLPASGSPEETARRLREQGVPLVALKIGAKGSVIAGAGEPVLIAGFRVDAVDTTAAGDAYTAGLAVALCEGQSLAEAARFANACGALATTRLGAQPSMPTRQEVEALLS
ncbi:MAG: hypothetical protein GF320_19290 [Armatimonadia bacterium]|nr:hypothetical protein [Armatimonadia bacterium]